MMHDHAVQNDLERMKREGAAKLAEADLEKRQREDAEANERRERDDQTVRTAIGKYRHRALRRVIFWLVVPGLPAFAIGIFAASFELLGEVGVALAVGGVVWLFGGLWLWSSEWLWRAGMGAMIDERRWLETRPFQVTGYFEWLARSSSSDASIALVIHALHLHQRRDEVKLLIAAVHPHVTSDSDHARDGGTRFVVSEIPGGDDDQRARIFHEIVDRVLVPLHHESHVDAVIVER